MRNHFDNINGAAALSFIGATMSGWNISEWAAAFALFYSALLCAQKLWQFVRWLKPQPPALP